MTFSFVYHCASYNFFFAAFSIIPVLVNIFNESSLNVYKRTCASKIELIRLVGEGGFKKDPYVSLVRITDRNEVDIPLQSYQVRPIKNGWM